MCEQHVDCGDLFWIDWRDGSNLPTVDNPATVVAVPWPRYEHDDPARVIRIPAHFDETVEGGEEAGHCGRSVQSLGSTRRTMPCTEYSVYRSLSCGTRPTRAAARALFGPVVQRLQSRPINRGKGTLKPKLKFIQRLQPRFPSFFRTTVLHAAVLQAHAADPQFLGRR